MNKSKRTNAKDKFARKIANKLLNKDHDLFKLIDYCSLSVLSASNWTQWGDFKSHILKYDSRKDVINVILKNANWDSSQIDDINLYSPIDMVYKLSNNCMFMFNDDVFKIFFYSEITNPKIKKYTYKDFLIKNKSIYSGKINYLLFYIDNMTDIFSCFDFVGTFDKVYISKCPLNIEDIKSIYKDRPDTKKLTEFLKLIGEDI